MDRLQDFINHQRQNPFISANIATDAELSAALTNGDIDVPEYFSISEDNDHLKIYDPEEGGSAQMGFIRIDYS